MLTNITASRQPFAQQGVALIVSLVMLVAITLIGVFAMSNSRLEWLMTNNSAFESDARLRAQAAAEDGIWWAVYSDKHHVSPTPPADPRIAANWGSLSPLGSASSITAPGDNNYFAELLGCYDEQSGTTCDPPISCKNDHDKCLFTYQVWARASDERGAIRIMRATVIKREVTYVPSAPGQAPTYTPTLLYKAYSEIDQ